MNNGYLKIQKEYLAKAWGRSQEDLEQSIPARFKEGGFSFQAFGVECLLCKDQVLLNGSPATGPEGLLVALYASQVKNRPVILLPYKAFKDLPNTMPYHAAFSANAERSLIPYVTEIEKRQDEIILCLSGKKNRDVSSGDFSLTLYPLPKVPLHYIFHLPDEEFPASVTCLFSANPTDFMPLDGLADVAEYTAKRIISIIKR